MSHQNPLIIGHRGASAHAPENTLASFELAIRSQQVDMIEFDIHLTRDGTPVILHDARIDRTTNGSGYVRDYDWNDLKRFDAGYHFDPDQDGSFPYRGKKLTIPRLEDLIEAYRTIPFAIEIKERSESLTQKVVTMLKEYNISDQCIVGSKYDAVSRTMREQFPRVKRFCSRPEIAGILLEMSTGQKPKKDPFAVASVSPGFLGIRFDTAQWTGHLKAKEMASFYWTIDSPEEMRHLQEVNANGIVTNDPKLARQVLNPEA